MLTPVPFSERELVPLESEHSLHCHGFLPFQSAVVNGPACSAASSPPIPGPQQTIYMLKEQNRLLTKVREA